jgi:hypothetical protein
MRYNNANIPSKFLATLIFPVWATAVAVLSRRQWARLTVLTRLHKAPVALSFPCREDLNNMIVRSIVACLIILLIASVQLCAVLVPPLLLSLTFARSNHEQLQQQHLHLKERSLQTGPVFDLDVGGV